MDGKVGAADYWAPMIGLVGQLAVLRPQVVSPRRLPMVCAFAMIGLFGQLAARPPFAPAAVAPFVVPTRIGNVEDFRLLSDEENCALVCNLENVVFHLW